MSAGASCEATNNALTVTLAVIATAAQGAKEAQPGDQGNLHP